MSQQILEDWAEVEPVVFLRVNTPNPTNLFGRMVKFDFIC
jgi:hypothetical protein